MRLSVAQRARLSHQRWQPHHRLVSLLAVQHRLAHTGSKVRLPECLAARTAALLHTAKPTMSLFTTANGRVVLLDLGTLLLTAVLVTVWLLKRRRSRARASSARSAAECTLGSSAEISRSWSSRSWPWRSRSPSAGGAGHDAEAASWRHVISRVFSALRR